MANGLTFLGNRWVFTGPQSYETEPINDGTGEWVVISVNAAGCKPIARCPHGAAVEMAGILNDGH
jgi:hypothetical protein